MSRSRLFKALSVVLDCDTHLDVASVNCSDGNVCQKSTDEFRVSHVAESAEQKAPDTTLQRLQHIDHVIPQTLPEQWPACLHPRLELEESRSHAVALYRAASHSGKEITLELENSLRNRGWSLQALNPNSKSGALADLVGAVVLLVDLTQIPYMIAWDVPTEGVYTYVFWFMVVYWSLDIVRSFFTGYTHRGEVELRLRVVSVRYLRTWFVADFAIVLIDWLSVFASLMTNVSLDASSYRMFRTAKVGRLLRILALFRILR